MRTATAAVLAVLMGSAASIAPVSIAPVSAQVASPPGRQTIVDHVQTVDDLAAVCDPGWTGLPRLEAIAYCQGFLTSAGQYHTLLYPRGGPARPLFCVPTPGPTIAQSGLAFAAWARENPGRGSEPALDGLLRWAQASFPCPSAAAPRTPRAAR